MDDSSLVRLLTLWFVVLTFIQTGSGGGNAVISAIGIFALLLAYALPAVILARLVERFVGE